MVGDSCWLRPTGRCNRWRDAVSGETAPAATTNCTKLKNLKNIFSPFALIKYHTGKPSNLA